MTDTTMTTSAVLNRAADLIEERGWSRGSKGWGTSATTQALCLEGGILAALGTNFIRVSIREWFHCPAYMAVASYLELSVVPRAIAGFDDREVWSWNDTPGRTATEVIEVLRACAVIEASRERQPAEVAS